jgi:hypothetical protein
MVEEQAHMTQVSRVRSTGEVGGGVARAVEAIRINQSFPGHGLPVNAAKVTQIR